MFNIGAERMLLTFKDSLKQPLYLTDAGNYKSVIKTMWLAAKLREVMVGFSLLRCR